MGKMHDALKKAQNVRPSVADAGDDPAKPASVSLTARPTAAAITNSFRSDLDPRLVTLVDPQGTRANQFRILRRNLAALGESQPANVLGVTSSVDGEGATIAAANLACAIAEDQEVKVALVDADLMNPSLHALFGLDNHRGLSEYLTGGTMLELVVQKCRLPNLWVLPGGHVPPASSELVGSKRMDDLMTRLRRDYDYVILVLPSLASSPDATILGPRCDGSILAVQMNRTQQDVPQHSILRLQEADAVVLGLVLTGIEPVLA